MCCARCGRELYKESPEEIVLCQCGWRWGWARETDKVEGPENDGKKAESK